MRLSQSEQDLSVTGTRPPSACSTSRPGSRYGRCYVKVANTSMADELLFSSSSSQLNLEEPNFDAPWAKKDRRQVLLWSPVTTPPHHSDRPSSVNTKKTTGKTTPKIKDVMLRNKHSYKLVKNRPSFVDECLFGPRLEEPSFVAPWNVKRRDPGNKAAVRPLHWDYSDYRSASQTDRGVSINLDLKHKSPAARCLSARSHTQPRPVWKP